jgi:hypothetical protein
MTGVLPARRAGENLLAPHAGPWTVLTDDDELTSGEGQAGDFPSSAPATPPLPTDQSYS